MRTRSCGTFAWGLAVVALIQSVQAGAGDDRSADEASARNQQIKEQMEASAKWYEVLPSAEASTPLTPQVAMRWINATRGRDAQDFMLLWVHDGRPVATASVFPFDRDLCHEVCSLSRNAELIARDGGGTVWAPKSAGVKFQDMPDAPAPAETAKLRLTQMKSLAARFTATLTGWKENESDTEVLRLLPSPLYRYDIPAGTETHPDLRDGALFAFVQGTDPEVLLLVEAVAPGDRLRWQYAFARATSGGLEARRGDELVWKVARSTNTTSRTDPEITFRRPLED